MAVLSFIFLAMSVLAHGVGRVYESPIPVGYYLTGAAAAVLASFVIRALSRPDRPHPSRRIAGPSVARGIGSAVRLYLLVAFGLVVVFSLVYPEEGGLGTPALMFWVAFVITTIVLCALIDGLWPSASPVETFDKLVRSEDTRPPAGRDVPDWLPPLAIYLLFWFELVSGHGFDPLWILGAALGYAVYVMAIKPIFGERSSETEPFGILFGFAQRMAPLEISAEGLRYRGFVAGLDQPQPMTPGLFAAVFILLASTTLDNLRETVQWFDFLEATGLDSLNQTTVLDSLALIALTIPFAVPYFLAAAVPARMAKKEEKLWTVARQLGWSLIPIGIAYVLAHNVTLLIIGFPALVNRLVENFGVTPFGGYTPSPLLAWILEIGLIVGGHIIGVLAAHRIAVKVTGSHRAALRSHITLTVLMSIYTVTTLWLLSLPLVSSN